MELFATVCSTSSCRAFLKARNGYKTDDFFLNQCQIPFISQTFPFNKRVFPLTEKRPNLLKSSFGKNISVITEEPPSAKSSAEAVSKYRCSRTVFSPENRGARLKLLANSFEKDLSPACTRSLKNCFVSAL